MYRTKRTYVPVVQLNLDIDAAGLLARILTMHKIQIDAGNQGSGSSIDKQRDFCITLSSDLKHDVEELLKW